MRLIDADKLKYYTVNDLQPDKMVVSRMMVSSEAINAEPTVEAIPVEWILNHPRFPHKNEDRKKCILDMIEDWERENGIS